MSYHPAERTGESDRDKLCGTAWTLTVVRTFVTNNTATHATNLSGRALCATDIDLTFEADDLYSHHLLVKDYRHI